MSGAEIAAVLTGLSALLSSVATVIAGVRTSRRVVDAGRAASEARDTAQAAADGVNQVERTVERHWRWQNGYGPYGGDEAGSPSPPARPLRPTTRRPRS